MTLRRLALAFALLFAATNKHALYAAENTGVTITKLDDRLRVEINGKLFTEYHFKDVPKPYCYPIIGPTGAGMTRDWPMKETDNEEHDHVHHRGFWYGHQSVNGVDFWSETPKSGKTVHKEFLEIKSGKDAGVIKTRNDWVALDGKVECSDVRTYTIYNHENDRMIDFEIRLEASNGDVVFGDEKDGAFATRVAETMRLQKKKEKGEKKAQPGEGHIVLSTGIRDNETWGKRAEWCDYYGPVDGKIVGVAMFDNPKNPRFPTWWHVREYGLFAANPFGQHYFEKLDDKKAGDMKIESGKSVTFRYRICWHAGNEKDAGIADIYKSYVAEHGGK